MRTKVRSWFRWITFFRKDDSLLLHRICIEPFKGRTSYTLNAKFVHKAIHPYSINICDIQHVIVCASSSKMCAQHVFHPYMLDKLFQNMWSQLMHYKRCTLCKMKKNIKIETNTMAESNFHFISLILHRFWHDFMTYDHN